MRLKVLLTGSIRYFSCIVYFCWCCIKSSGSKHFEYGKIPEFHVAEQFVEGMHGAEHLAVGIALVGLAVGIGLFAFAYGAVKSFAKQVLVLA